MRLFILTTLTMFAFAGNSLLNRAALLDQQIGPAEFAVLRVIAGVFVLLAILVFRNRGLPKFAEPNLSAIFGLSVYLVCFSFAYVAMDAGLGAIILFGVVQVTMFLGVLREGVRPTRQRWIGMLVAFVGVVLLSLPNEAANYTYLSVGLMACAAMGWGVYSLIGREVTDPLASTFWNFLYSVPVVLLSLLIWSDVSSPTAQGIGLALTSGGVTSAIGYALWYSVLPSLGATRSALAQLSVPGIALLVSISFLGELLTLNVVVAGVFVVVGIAIGLLPSNERSE